MNPVIRLGRKEWGSRMANLFKLELGKFNALTGKLAEAGLTAELGEAILKDPSLARVGVEAIEAKLAEMAKPRTFALTLDAQLARFRAANAAQGWGFGEEVFETLAANAPEWPEGTLCVRSLRIRFGEGDTGVARTFEAHASEIERVFTSARYWRWEHLHSAPAPYTGSDKKLQKRFGSDPIARLKLLAGNETHKSVVEWIVIDLDAHRERQSIEAVRSKTASLADELLVVAWMFPELIRSIDYDEVPAMFAAGYELNVPERGEVEWQFVPYVYFHAGHGQVELGAGWHSCDFSNYSVPALRECKR